jgi:hypothetical protein
MRPWLLIHPLLLVALLVPSVFMPQSVQAGKELPALHLELVAPIRQLIVTGEVADIGRLNRDAKPLEFSFDVVNEEEKSARLLSVEVGKLDGPVKVALEAAGGEKIIDGNGRARFAGTITFDPDFKIEPGREAEDIPFLAQLIVTIEGGTQVFFLAGAVQALNCSGCYHFEVRDLGNGSYLNDQFDTFSFGTWTFEQFPAVRSLEISIINDSSSSFLVINNINVFVWQKPFGVDLVSNPSWDNFGIPPGGRDFFQAEVHVDRFSESGQLEFEVSYDFQNASTPDGRLTVEGNLLLAGCQVNCPGRQIRVTNDLDQPVGSLYSVSPEIGQQQQIGLRIHNPGTESLNVFNISVSGDRFSLVGPRPQFVPANSFERFVLGFNAVGITATQVFTGNVVIQSNADNAPLLSFAVRVGIPVGDDPTADMQISVGPYPAVTEPELVHIPWENGVFNIEDATLPEEPGVPNARRVTLRVKNLNTNNGDDYFLSDFRYRFTDARPGLSWQWDDPQPVTGTQEIEIEDQDRYFFSGRFVFDPQTLAPGSFALEVSFRWRRRPGFGQLGPFTHRFLIVGRVTTQRAAITPTVSAFDHTTPPSFVVNTGKPGYHYQVQVTLAKRLFDTTWAADHAPGRLTAADYRKNYFESPFLQSDAIGQGGFTIPQDQWQYFKGARLFYRVVTARDVAGTQSRLLSTPDAQWADAPWVDIVGAPWYGQPLHDRTQATGGGGTANTFAGGRFNTDAISSDYGPRTPGNYNVFHPGLDVPFGNQPSQPVYAVADGQVTCFEGGQFGRVDINHGNYRTGYIHLTNWTLVCGTTPVHQVAAGQLIGYSGSTAPGGTTHHLHLDSGNGVIRNPLARLNYTDRHTLTDGSGTFLSDAQTQQREVNVVAAAGNQHKALVAFGITSGHDKDLDYVHVEVDPNLPTLRQAFELDYNEVTRAGTGNTVIPLRNGRSFRIRADSVYTDPDLQHDFYVLPTNTTVNSSTADYFFFVWNTAPFAADDGAGPHTIRISLNNAQRNNSVTREVTIGPQITAGNVQVNGLSVTQVLTVTNYDVTAGQISLALQNVPANWNPVLSNARPTIAANGNAAVTLSLTRPNQTATLPANAKIVATFDRIPDLKDSVTLNLGINVNQVVEGSEAAVSESGLVDFGLLAQTNGAVNRTIRVRNTSRHLDLVIALQPVQSNAIGTGGVNRLRLAPGQIGEFPVTVATSQVGNKEAIITLSQSGVGSFPFTVRAQVVAPGAPPGDVPSLSGTVNGLALDGLTIYQTQAAITLNWSHASHPSGIERYQLVLRPIDSGSWTHSTQVLYPTTSHSFTVSNLEFGRSYSVHIRAKSNEGFWGNFRTGGVFSVVAPGVPSSVPSFTGQHDGLELNGRTLYLTNPVLQFNWGHATDPSGIERYHLVVQPTDGSGWLYGRQALYPATSFSLNTEGLVYGMSYSYHIRAKNNAGVWGPFVLGGIFTIQQSPPSSVPGFVAMIDGQLADGLTVHQTNPTVHFTWGAATHPSGIERYQVVLQPTDGSGWLYSPHVLSPATTFTLNTADLQYGLSYSFHIRAKSAEGLWGPFVRGGEFSVQQSPPSAVPDCMCLVNGQPLDGAVITQPIATITLNWGHATHPAGIERYQLVLKPTDTGVWTYSTQVLYPANSHSFTVTNLEAGRSYSIHLRAKSTEGIWGPFGTGGVFQVQLP